MPLVIRKISVRKFMSHEAAAWDFQKSGVVRVSGPNGAGKSSIIEAVAWGLFGKTLRGTMPFGPDGGEVTVTTDRLWVNRKREGDRTKLVWAFLGEDPVEYESASKANAELQKSLGVSFEAWRRTSVFSSSDSALFAQASDAERKRLLEELLGIDRFDTALDTCRADLRQKEKEVAAIDSNILRKQELLANEILGRERLKDLQSLDIPDIGELDLEIGRVSGEIHDVEQELQAQQVEAAGLRDKIEEYRRNCRLLEASLWRLSKGVCPTCEQGIPNVAVSALRESLDKLVNDNGAEISDDDERLGILQRSIKALRDQQTRLWGDLNSLKQSRVRALEQQSQAARVAESLAEADSRIAGFDSDVLKLKEQRGAAHAEFKELEACERALGYRGIRANLLGRALGGLQSVCNVWLKRISGRTWVDIKPYTERKSGSVSECIALRVNGAGGGQGYAGSSGGERRRIDVALILALGEFAASSNGLRGGTIFCDEVFDAIDSEGVEPVAEAISSISEERLAIVISHNPAVLGLLKGPHIRIGG